MIVGTEERLVLIWGILTKSVSKQRH